jgi:hypothetical protein
MISREFAALYPSQVVGMVLIDASREPEIPIYDRLHAGPWLDGTVTPAPNRRIDIHATVRQLEHAPPLHTLPLIVITAGILEDQWLRTVPLLEARAQTRLADLSTNSVHIVDKGVGHFIPQQDPNVVVDAVDAVIISVSHRRAGWTARTSRFGVPQGALLGPLRKLVRPWCVLAMRSMALLVVRESGT